MLVTHRRDGLIEWMKDLINHSFVLDVMEQTIANTMSHIEELFEEHHLNPTGR